LISSSFYQWPKSKLREHGEYKKLRNHVEIVGALSKVYGSADDVREKIRYVSAKDIVKHVTAAGIPDLDAENLQERLPLFSLAELLYRYLRCDAVHNAEFPFINERIDAEGNVEYEENHAITGKALFETVQGVVSNLRDECLKSGKWPGQL